MFHWDSGPLDIAVGTKMKLRQASLILLVADLCSAQQFLVSTLVGGNPPSTPATAASAWVGNPDSVSASPSGDVYFTSLHCVFRVDANGVIWRVAGTSRKGFSGDGGLALNAQLFSPAGVVADTAGNLYIADAGNNRIRRVAPDGVIATVAGGGAATGAGPAVAAALETPVAVALDRDGSLLVLEFGANRIRRVNQSGLISPVPVSAGLKGPTSLAVDDTGNIYVADAGNNAVRRISPQGVTTTVAGTGTRLGLNFPDGVAVDGGGTLYISDSGNQRIVKLQAPGLTVVAGNGTGGYAGDGGLATKASLYYPNDVALGADGTIFIADSANGRIRSVASDGTITTVAGNGSIPPIEVPAPAAVAAAPSGDLYFSDTSRHRVRRISPGGIVTTAAGTGAGGFDGDAGPAANAQLDLPTGLAVDGSGNLFIADSGNNRIRKVSSDGKISTVFGDGAAATLGLPTGLSLDAAGNLYVTEIGSNRVRKVAPNGSASVLASTGLSAPSAVAVGADGTVYVCDTGNNRVVAIANGATRTVATGKNPAGVAVDASGNVWYADTGADRLVRVGGPSLGLGADGYAGDGGPASTALFSGPTSLGFDATGHLFVVDDGNGAIRMLSPINRNTVVSAVYDAAGESALPLSPGKIVVIYGAGLGPSTLALFQVTNSAIGTDLGGTRVTFNGIAAPLIYTSANQVAAIVPYAVTGATAQVVVSYGGEVSAAFPVAVSASAPSLFTANSTGAGQAAAINVSTGALNSAATPVRIGEYLSVYATGEGLTGPTAVDGKLASFPLPTPNLPVSATVGGVPTTIQYAGGVPGNVAGLMQVNILVPSGIATGGYVPVVLKVGSASSSTGVWISVVAQ